MLSLLSRQLGVSLLVHRHWSKQLVSEQWLARRPQQPSSRWRNSTGSLTSYCGRCEFVMNEGTQGSTRHWDAAIEDAIEDGGWWVEWHRLSRKGDNRIMSIRWGHLQHHERGDNCWSLIKAGEPFHDEEFSLVDLYFMYSRLVLVTESKVLGFCQNNWLIISYSRLVHIISRLISGLTIFFSASISCFFYQFELNSIFLFSLRRCWLSYWSLVGLGSFWAYINPWGWSLKVCQEFKRNSDFHHWAAEERFS